MKHTLLLLALMNVAAFTAEKMPRPAAHSTRNNEGWTVRVDDRLLKGQHAPAFGFDHEPDTLQCYPCRIGGSSRETALTTTR